ncbi:MAG: YncE family protein, partial [Thermodesulfobacteriota bacterium]|nr:YncE family protein [Thermodesulfobacteriota bacterium]
SGVGSNPTDVMIYDEHIFVANAGSNNIYQISIKSFGIEKEITAGFGSHRVALGLMNRIYVANRNSNDISIIPSSMSMAIQRIAVGDLPQEMVIDRERRKLYVANEGTNTVSVIDLVREKLIGSIPVGKQPYGLALIE